MSPRIRTEGTYFTMKRHLLLVTVVLIFVTMLLSGCDNTTAQANALIGQADAHMKKAMALSDQTAALEQQINTLDGSPASAATGLDLIKQLKDKLAQQKTEMGGALQAYAGVDKIGVKPTVKKYAKLEAAVIQLGIQRNAEYGKLYDAMTVMFTGIRDNNATEAQTASFLATSDTITANVDKLNTQVQQASDDALSYYQANVAAKK
jgi:exonuclease VII small subunit